MFISFSFSDKDLINIFWECTSRVSFTKNIDSVRIKDSALSCLGFDFKGLSYTNTNPISGSGWQWYFGDGGTANTQNTSHTYGTAGADTVKLVITDINGCKDSISKVVNTNPFTADAGNDTALCASGTVSVTLHASAAVSYSWTPATYLSATNIANPIATPTATTTYVVTSQTFNNLLTNPDFESGNVV